MMQLTINKVAGSRILALGTLLATLMAAFIMLAASHAQASTTFTVNSTADHPTPTSASTGASRATP